MVLFANQTHKLAEEFFFGDVALVQLPLKVDIPLLASACDCKVRFFRFPQCVYRAAHHGNAQVFLNAFFRDHCFDAFDQGNKVDVDAPARGA